MAIESAEDDTTPKPHTGPSKPLNAEPSQPKDRKAQGLAPKSYLAAADEPIEDGYQASDKKIDSKSPSKPARSPKSSTKGSTNDGDSNKQNGVAPGVANVNGESQLVQEYGSQLTSTRPPPGYKVSLAQDAKERKPTAQPYTKSTEGHLVSGKQVGQRWSQSAVRFAPLNVPVQRRLQTAAVLFHALSIAAMPAIFLFICTIPIFWPLAIPYLIYTLMSNASTSGELSHRSEWLRRSPLWSLYSSYFPARLHRSEELPPTRKYVFGYHPHGIIAHGAFSAFVTETLGFAQLFPGITNTLLTLDSNFRIPFYRDYALAMGLASVSRESCTNLLSKGGMNGEGMGRAITIVVGGARESLDAKPGLVKLVLKRRKGFIKLAIRSGADLVPVIGFGENDLYDQFQADSNVHKIQLWVKKMVGFTVPLFHGRGIFNYDVGLMPYRRPLNTVVGRAIQVEQQDKPEEAYIDEIHSKYVAELERIWHTHKDHFARDRESELEIVE